MHKIARLAIHDPKRFYAGLVLIAVSLFALWATANLSQGTARMMGAAMFPRMLALMLGASGIALLALSFWTHGDPLERWSLRGPFFVTVSILAFAVTIRPLGLAVAGILTLVLSGFATPETRLREVVVFSVVMTVLCIVLFRYILGMSVTVLIVPGTGIKF